MTSDKSKVTPADQARYHKQAQDWEADKTARIEQSERRAWLVAGAAAIVALVAVIGIALVGKLKTVQPFLLAMDKTSGNIEVVDAADDRAVKGYQELLDKHWAKKYVIARESYIWTLLQLDYDTVLALSGDGPARDYARKFDGPDALDKKLGAGVERRIKVLSVTLPPDETGKAVVRFERTEKRVEADTADLPQTFVATLAYEYKPGMRGKEADLIENPLGYKVTAYRADAEIATTSPAPKTASAQ